MLSKLVPAHSWLERLGFHSGADFGGRTLIWGGLTRQLFKHIITLRRPLYVKYMPRKRLWEGYAAFLVSRYRAHPGIIALTRADSNLLRFAVELSLTWTRRQAGIPYFP